MKYILSILVLTLTLACSDSSSDRRIKVITDLPFGEAKTAKEYADVVLKAIKTNRDKPLLAEFSSSDTIDPYKFNTIIGMYSTGIGGRDDWEYIDLYETSNEKVETAGFDFAWLDPSGRLGLQIYIEPKPTDNGYRLGKLEFRSRIDVLETIAFPADESIEDYKKLDYNWEVIDARRKG